MVKLTCDSCSVEMPVERKHLSLIASPDNSLHMLGVQRPAKTAWLIGVGDDGIDIVCSPDCAVAYNKSKGQPPSIIHLGDRSEETDD